MPSCRHQSVVQYFYFIRVFILSLDIFFQYHDLTLRPYWPVIVIITKINVRCHFTKFLFLFNNHVVLVGRQGHGGWTGWLQWRWWEWRGAWSRQTSWASSNLRYTLRHTHCCLAPWHSHTLSFFRSWWKKHWLNMICSVIAEIMSYQAHVFVQRAIWMWFSSCLLNFMTKMRHLELLIWPLRVFNLMMDSFTCFSICMNLIFRVKVEQLPYPSSTLRINSYLLNYL